MAKIEKQEWKNWQCIYHMLLIGRPGIHFHEDIEYSGEKVENALRLLEEEPKPSIYPAKSRLVAIVYAKLIEQIYGEEFYETLNDPALLYGHAIFNATYLEDMDTYDAIIERLKEFPDWLEMGAVPKIVEQFHLECTQKGADSFKTNSMTE